MRALYERIGCEVIEQTAEGHDRVMAHTHALTFFVAKGMIDAGAGMEVPFAPPSFQAIARTIETVRSDAGHLFAAIARDNPFAAEARKQLVQALAAIDRALDAQAAAGARSDVAGGPSGRLRHPRPGRPLARAANRLASTSTRSTRRSCGCSRSGCSCRQRAAQRQGRRSARRCSTRRARPR